MKFESAPFHGTLGFDRRVDDLASRLDNSPTVSPRQARSVTFPVDVSFDWCVGIGASAG